MNSNHDTEKHYRRRSIRLKDYDYSQAGAYFVTICTKDKQCLFGEIVEGKMRLNKIGRMVEKTWRDIPTRFPSVELDEYIVMPNHIHGSIVIVGATLAVARSKKPDSRRAGASLAPTLGDIVGAFKSITAIKYLNHIKKTSPRSSGKLWQRNYYEHIIRDDHDLRDVGEYINNNLFHRERDENRPTTAFPLVSQSRE